MKTNHLLSIGSALLLSIVVVSCERESEQAIVTVPLYDSCYKHLPAYEEKLHRLGYEVALVAEDFERFQGRAYPGIRGVLTISGVLEEKSISEIISGLRILCFPLDTIEIEATEIGLFEFAKVMRQANSREVFVTLEDGMLTVDTNSATDQQKKLILQ